MKSMLPMGVMRLLAGFAVAEEKGLNDETIIFPLVSRAEISPPDDHTAGKVSVGYWGSVS